MDISISVSISSDVPIVSGGGSGVTPPLDTYTGAQTAYSIARLLRTAYTGDAIRVRRSSDNAELDIGFTAGGDLDETALLAHVGANDGFIVTTYDQSANTNHWTQATANLQPRIVSSGVVDKVNGRPAILSDETVGSSDCLTATVTGVANTTSFQVVKTIRDSVVFNSNPTGAVFYGIAMASSASSTFSGSGTPTIYVNGSTVTNTRDDLRTATSNIQAIVTHTNLTLTHSGWTGYNTDYVNDSFNPPDYIQETIIYDSDKSSDRSDIETNINDYYTIY